MYTLKMLIIKLSLFCLSANYVTGISLMGEGKTLVLDRFNGSCTGKNVAILGTFNIIRKSEAKTIYFNVTMDVREDVQGKPLFNMQGYRCSSKENLDSCEKFMEHKGLSYCQLIDPRAERLSPVYIKYTPIYKCPLKTGVYHSYNTKLDTSALVVFPLGNYYWRAKVQVVDEKTSKILMCIEVDLHSRPSGH